MRLTDEMRLWIRLQARETLLANLVLGFSARFNLTSAETGKLLAEFLRQEYKLF
jgi:hypothetical protein